VQLTSIRDGVADFRAVITFAMRPLGAVAEGNIALKSKPNQPFSNTERESLKKQ